MKLAQKITYSMVAVLGVLFTLGVALMIRQSFTRSLTVALQRGGNTHIAQKDALRRYLVEQTGAGEALRERSLELAGASLSASFEGEIALLADGITPVYNTLPGQFDRTLWQELQDMEAPGYKLYRFGDEYYLALCSQFYVLEKDICLISVLDFTQVFEEQLRQTLSFLNIFPFIFILASLFIYLVVNILVRPLQRLNAVSGEIAAGSYATRVGLKRRDEIGELGRNFDEMAAAVEEKVESLQLSVRQREDFMGAFTHELKTPMTAMMGYAALLQKGSMPPEKQAKALEYIHSETHRLEGLSQKMLMLMGLSEEKMEPRPVLLAEILDGARRAVAPFEDCRVELPPAGDCGDIWVLADADLITDLLLNLIHNAMRAAPADGCVRVAIEQGEGRCTLLVRDKGRGIPPDELARIQEPFYRVDKSRAAGQNGSGLGLAICARIAHMHNTTLQFQSSPGKGTTVSVTLPAVPAPQCEETVPEVNP